MKNIGEYFRALVGGIISFSTLDSYRRTIITEKQNAQTINTLEKVIHKYEEVTIAIESKKEELINTQTITESVVSSTRRSLELIKEETSNLIEATKNNNKELIETSINNLSNFSQDAYKELNKIYEIIKGSDGSNFISNY